MSSSSFSEGGSTARNVMGVLVAVVLVASALSSFAGMNGYYSAYAQDSSNNSNNLDVQVTKPTPELTAQWWQWILSIPADENPLTDTTGED
jgi:hypothetical protein